MTVPNSPKGPPRRRWRVGPDEWQEILDIRSGLWRCGYITIPCDEEGKKPLFAGWPKFQYDPKKPEPPIPRTLNGAGNPTKAPHFGTGVTTTGLVTFDLDLELLEAVEEARITIEEIAGPAPLVRYRDNSARIMMIYGAAGSGWRTSADDWVKTPHGNIGTDSNHPGQFVHLHGLHPSGARLRYEDRTPWETPTHQLPKISKDTIAAIGAELGGAQGVEVKSLGNFGRKQKTDRKETEFGAFGLANVLPRILTGQSVTKSIEIAAEIMINDMDLMAHVAEELLHATLLAAKKARPQDADRFENGISQLGLNGRQRVGIVRAIENKRDARRTAETNAAMELAMEAEAKSDRIRRTTEIVNRMPQAEIDSLAEWLIQYKGAKHA